MSETTTSVVNLLQDLLPDLGASLVLLPDSPTVGYVQFNNGRRSFFYNFGLDLNGYAASTIVHDKALTVALLRAAGINVPTHLLFGHKLPPKWLLDKRDLKRIPKAGLEAAQAFAEKVGYPVVVKPNASRGGKGITFVDNTEEMTAVADIIAVAHPMLLVESWQNGRDHRVVILNGQVLAAYERRPATVIGDGINGMRGLIEIRQKQLEEEGYNGIIPWDDESMDRVLHRQSLSRTSVPKAGRSVQLFDNANISNGGTLHDMRDKIHPDYVALCQKVAQTCGLILAGVDVLNDDISAPIDPDKPEYTIIEVNASPGLANLYASGGARRKQVPGLTFNLGVFARSPLGFGRKTINWPTTNARSISTLWPLMPKAPIWPSYRHVISRTKSAILILPITARCFAILPLI